MALRHFTLSSSLCAETIGATWEVRSENNMERVRAMIAPPSYLYEVSSARAPEGFHSVKEEPQRKDFQVDFPHSTAGAFWRVGYLEVVPKAPKIESRVHI